MQNRDLRVVAGLAPVLAVAIAAGACSGGEAGAVTTSTGPGGGAGGAGGCPSGLSACAGQCVATSVDPAHCGGCDQACAPEQVCSAGQCGMQCVGGTTKCSGKCVDVQTDPENCGGCNGACGVGEVCSAGQCALQCLGGTTKCGNACVDTKLDPANCGGCGKACGGGQYCKDGGCLGGGVVFSEQFSQGQTPSGQCTAWNTFRAALVGNYSKITISGTYDLTGVSCTGPNANALCQALRNNQTLSLTCDGRNWQTGQCNAIELSAAGSICQCPNAQYIVRPCIGNNNWGGANTATCNGPTQVLTVRCE
ncbi:MAG: hypothetical protein HY744_19255 [Deltaproteobacteria bacterium]|nr:hypothetical protein [Deltaproteobacteria bacterium]